MVRKKKSIVATKWSKAHSMELQRLWAYGKTARAIGTVFNITESNVNNRVTRLRKAGWTFSRRRGRIKPEEDTRTKAIRICLTCKSEFNSSWIGNRVCLSCKDTISSFYV